MRKGTSFYNDRLVGSRPDGTPSLLEVWARVKTTGRPLIMVHGYQFDPRKKGKRNPHTSVFDEWSAMLGMGHRCFGFGWFSVPRTFMSTMRSWFGKKTTNYHRAWHLATAAGRQGLARVLEASPMPPDILCHSLGSRVVMQALNENKGMHAPRMVLILNGADYAESAARTAQMYPGTKFYNVVVEADQVLSVGGALGAPGHFYEGVLGQVGLGKDAPLNWVDIVLDNDEVKAWVHMEFGFRVEGDNPLRISDHWYTYTNDNNKFLWRWILSGNKVDPPRVL